MELGRGTFWGFIYWQKANKRVNKALYGNSLLHQEK